MNKKIRIEKITIREQIEVKDEQERLNLKYMLAEALNIKPSQIEMRFEDTTEQFTFNEGL